MEPLDQRYVYARYITKSDGRWKTENNNVYSWSRGCSRPGFHLGSQCARRLLGTFSKPKAPFTLNKNSINQFSVTNGTVDLFGNGFFDFYPSQGRYVDLDGSSSNAGLLTTTSPFATGTYTLDFVLGGSTCGDTNTIQVSLGDFAQDITLASNAGLTNLSLTFQTTTAGTLRSRTLAATIWALSSTISPLMPPPPRRPPPPSPNPPHRP